MTMYRIRNVTCTPLFDGNLAPWGVARCANVTDEMRQLEALGQVTIVEILHDGDEPKAEEAAT
jgi:hypothetical protein